MNRTDIPEKGSRRELSPRNVVESDGTRYHYNYSFGSVAVSAASETLNNIFTSVEMHYGFVDGVLWYQYRDNDPIFITEDTVFCSDDADGVRARQDAYYALSMLDDAGYVSRFREQ